MTVLYAPFIELPKGIVPQGTIYIEIPIVRKSVQPLKGFFNKAYDGKCSFYYDFDAVNITCPKCKKISKFDYRNLIYAGINSEFSKLATFWICSCGFFVTIAIHYENIDEVLKEIVLVN